VLLFDKSFIRVIEKLADKASFAGASSDGAGKIGGGSRKISVRAEKSVAKQKNHRSARWSGSR